MIFSRIRLREGISSREAAIVGKATEYHVHQIVWGFFSNSPECNRDFLYRFEVADGRPSFFTVSSRAPRVDGPWSAGSKPYGPILHAGQQLAFSLRVNPIVSKRDEQGRQHRHDVVMQAKIDEKAKGLPFNEAELIQKRGGEWLAGRGDRFGFTVHRRSLRADSYRQHSFSKNRGKTHIRYSTLDFNGILTVIDPDAFVRDCLFGGVGPAKGFGCGLMLVKRV